jgi:hypothetical protein
LRGRFSSDTIDRRADLFRVPVLMICSSRHAVREAGRLLFRGAGAMLIIALVALLPATHRRVAAAAATAAPHGAADAGAVPAGVPAAFRLGNAAGAFGWSTAVGDFNADGRLDEIVADRVAPHAAGYRYRIDFEMSGQAPEHVTFDSARDAVAITVSDVDRDNDLDVVARAVLSGETIGLWLNDGHGHFTSADARQLPATLEATQTVGTTDPPLQSVTAGVPPRRADVALPVAFRAPPSGSRTCQLSSATPFLPGSTPASPSRPRAPPQRSIDVPS